MLVCKNHAKQIRRVRKPLTNGDVVVLQTEKRTSKSEKYTENQRMKFSVAAALGVPISLVGEIYSIFSANDNLETLQKGPSKNTTALSLIELYECFLNQSAFIMSESDDLNLCIDTTIKIRAIRWTKKYDGYFVWWKIA